MINEKTNEFETFIQAFIEANGEETFSKRIHWKSFPEKILANAVKRINIPGNETILMILDSSLMGSGKDGMVLTDWGVRYNDSVNAFSLSWNDLSEKYSFVQIKTDGALGIKGDALLLQAKPDDDLAVNKEISLSMTNINYDILARILSKSCQIFTGNSIGMPKSNTGEVPSTNSEVQSQSEPTQPISKAQEEPTPAQKREMERWRKQDAREYEELENLRNNRSGKTGSFFFNNIAGIITAIIMTIIGCLATESVAGIILALPLSFIGYIVGNKIRIALHPDFVIADGFMGLLKEKIFWRYVPQLIGAFLGAVFGLGIIASIFS